MANVLIWRGDAQPRKQVTNVAPSLFGPGDKCTLTINRKSVTFQVPSDTADEDVVAAFVSAGAAAVGQYSNKVAEFAEISAGAGTNAQGETTHLTLTGPKDGTPFEVTGTTADAGDFAVLVEPISAGDPGQNEIQRVSAGGATGGTFTLSFAGQETDGIAYNATAATVLAAIEALGNVAPGDVTVTADGTGAWLVEYKGGYAAENVPALVGDGSSLTGVADAVVNTATDGSPSLNRIDRLTLLYPENHQGPGGSNFGFMLMDNATGEIGYAGVTWGAGASGVQSQLNFLASSRGYYDNPFRVTGSWAEGFGIEYTGSLAGTNESQVYLDADANYGYAEGTDYTWTTTQEASDAPASELQTVTITGQPTGGTWTLTFQGQATAAIAHNATAAAVQAALEALSNIASGDVSVTKSGWTYTITFTGYLAGEDLAQMTADGSGLTGGAVLVSTEQEARAAIDAAQRVTLTNNPQGGTWTLSVDLGSGDETTAALDFGATAAELQAALEALPSVAPGDVTVTGQAGGPWTLSWGGAYAGTDVATPAGDGSNLTGSGTQSVTVAAATEPTGPNWWSEPKNWQTVGSETANAPAAGDTIYVRNSDVPILYGLEKNSGDTLAAMHVEQSMTGSIGLPNVNSNGYFEYRPKSLKVGITKLVVGESNGGGSPLMRFDLEAAQNETIVRNTGQSQADLPSLLLKGTHADNVLRVARGEVGVAMGAAGETAKLALLEMSFIDSQDTDAQVSVGAGVTQLTTITKSGGSLQCWADFGALENLAGDAAVFGDADCSTLLRVDSGSIDWQAGDIIKLEISGEDSEIDFRQDLRAKTVTNATIGAGAALLDTYGVVDWINPITLDDCGIEDVTLELGKDITLTPAAA